MSIKDADFKNWVRGEIFLIKSKRSQGFTAIILRFAYFTKELKKISNC